MKGAPQGPDHPGSWQGSTHFTSVGVDRQFHVANRVRTDTLYGGMNPDLNRVSYPVASIAGALLGVLVPGSRHATLRRDAVTPDDLVDTHTERCGDTLRNDILRSMLASEEVALHRGDRNAGELSHLFGCELECFDDFSERVSPLGSIFGANHGG